MHQRHGPNQIRSLSHGFKGFIGNLASLMFYPPVFIAWLHKIRGVKIKNIRKLYITFNVMLDNVFPELITIGEDVWLTRNVSILTHFNPSEAQRRALGDIICKEVVIEDGVFIGINSIVLPGVTIGKNSVVGAGSVVTKDVPQSTIVAGNPATIIRSFTV